MSIFKIIIKTSFILILTTSISVFSYGQTTLKLKKEGEIYLIPCKINGIAYDLYFDTGATLVSLSLTEARELIKSGKLSKEDIIGKTQMSIADGQLVNGTIILIRELKIGDLIMDNVEAVITETQDAPLLLGQSAIKNFGEFTFNYADQTLKINKLPKASDNIIIPKLHDVHRKGFTPEQLASYESFYKHKAEIINNLVIELGNYKVYQKNGDNYISFSFDITNNSQYDFSLSKQLLGNPVKLINIVVTIYTEEGKNYTGKEKLPDILSLSTISTSSSFVDINIRQNKIRGIKIRAMDLDF